MSKKESTHLAHVRTHLANERTFLSYIRTALAFIAAGLAIIRFLPTHFIDALLLIALGLSFLLFGLWRYGKYKQHINHIH
ncbi:DUF202 domain-containing protein [Candidatus Woesearchaeota archaeon]|nr:DUF202 domain-containing protein [Candidatus Woesearchaeota archaeon]